jgi:hypothetical protein
LSFGYHETEREQALQLLCLDETRCGDVALLMACAVG